MWFSNEQKKTAYIPINDRKMNGYICTISSTHRRIHRNGILLRFCVRFVADFSAFGLLFSIYSNKNSVLFDIFSFDFILEVWDSFPCGFTFIEKNWKFSTGSGSDGIFVELYFTFISCSLRIERNQIKMVHARSVITSAISVTINIFLVHIAILHMDT